jgi:hypothetical protein
VRTFNVPSGIGDFSWAYSKLKHAGMANWCIADGWPHRTVPYVKLLDNVNECAYGPFNYTEIVRYEEQVCKLGITPTWEQVEKFPGTSIYIEPNRHLELGRRLEDWLPDLPCDFHYKINVPQDEAARAVALLSGMKRPIWGISCASYRGSEAWKTWGHDQWALYLKMLEAEVGGTILMLGGFWDDLTSTVASSGGYKDIVGRTSVPMMVSVLDLLDGYIGFSSGMGVIRTVLSKPVFMMWPDHQVELSTSWAPLEMLESRAYVASLWREPRLVFERTKDWIRRNF